MNAIKQAAGIALLALILGFSINHIRQDGLSVIESQEDLFPQSLEEKELEGISIEDAQEILNAGKSIFVDLRPKNDFERSHIPKSVNFPSKHTHNLFAFLDQQISKQTEIILIGADKEDDTPTEVALVLQMMGYENVKIMAEGWAAWHEKYLKE
jgi:rhodanese-related sulfurtransferase